MQQIKTTVEFWREGPLYIAYAPELDMVAQGKTMEEARRNLFEVIEIQLEEIQQLGYQEQHADSGHERGGVLQAAG